jgi:predicted phage-related endonuclease
MSHKHYPSHPAELAEQDAFRAARRDGLYSTDSVAILQLSRYSSPLSVYLDKVEPIPPAEPASLQAWLGWRLEDTVAQLYAERYGGATPKRMDATYSHLALPFVKTHLDYARLQEGVLVEAKTRTQRSPAWGPDGSSKVPPDVWVQVQHELMVMASIHPKVTLARIPVLFGLHTFNVFEVEADPIFHEKLLAELERFWHEHVVAQVPPEPIAMPVDIAWSKRHPLTDQSLPQATPEMEQLMKRVRLAKLAVSQAEQVRDALDAQVRELIGERAGLVGLFGEVTYRPTSGRVDWKLLSGTYLKGVQDLGTLVEMVAKAGLEPRVALERLDLIRAQAQNALGLYTKPGERRLNYTWNEGEH